jgi:uncharacterized protein YndB with AHSA1/START domain
MTDQPTLSESLDRTLSLAARRETVFSFFTESERWEAWWGAGSRIDPRPGGEARIRYPNGIEAGGVVLEVSPPHRLVFTFGFLSGEPIPLGASRVTIELIEAAPGTLLRLRHEFAEATVRDAHVQGWRYQLALFANLVADTVQVSADAVVDAWFAAWSEPEPNRRHDILRATVGPGVQFRDRFSATDGVDDLEAQLEAVHRFMPGTTLARAGDLRHCQSTALADWTATGADGTARGSGTNAFRFDSESRLVEIVGIWNAG